MKLGDLSALKGLTIAVGSVFRVECFPEDGVTPKGEGDTSRHKYIVIVGIDKAGNYIGATLINTNINENYKHIIGKYQREIHPERYKFLGGQSRFVNCYEMKPFPKERILEKATFIATLEEEDMQAIKELVKSSPITDRITIKRFNL